MRTKHSQGGAILIVGLIILVILTVLAVSAMQTTTLEERMAGNFLRASAAFQATEASLREGEGSARTSDQDDATANGANGVWIADALDSSPSDGTPWWEEVKDSWSSVGIAYANADDLKYGNNLTAAEAPRYVLEFMERTDLGDTLNRGKDADTSQIWLFFRQTGFGTDTSDNANVVLRSTFGMPE